MKLQRKENGICNIKLLRLNLTNEDFSKRQIEILNLLLNKEYQQKELQEALDTSGSNLHYHLNRLEKLNLIRKNTLYEVGNAKINSISLNPAARQQVRKIIGKEISNYTLIIGFGLLETGYKIPDSIFRILKKYHYPISKIVCFTTKESKEKRDENSIIEDLKEIDEFLFFQYEEYRYIESEFFNSVETKISEEMEDANIIIDVTLLSKLFSFKLLELSNKYQIPCAYLGMDKDGEKKLYLLSNMKIQVNIEALD